MFVPAQKAKIATYINQSIIALVAYARLVDIHACCLDRSRGFELKIIHTGMAEIWIN